MNLDLNIQEEKFMKFNLNKIMRYFFLFMMINGIILFSLNKSLDYKIVQLIAITSFSIIMYNTFKDDKEKEN